MFARVSLVVLSRTRLLDEKTTIGGLLENALKKLYGARFGFPSESRVLTNAIGLGATVPRINWWKSFVGMVPGSIVRISI
jgi:hypothetical protein